MNDLKTYRLTLAHDNGKIRILITSRCISEAIRQVTAAESCSESAIVKIETLKTNRKP